MKVLIVLGNRLNDDGSMTDIMLSRLNKGAEVYFAGGIDIVIVSGGMPNKKAAKTEAACMKKYLVQTGVPSELVIMEDKSNTTVENAKFCAPIIKNLGAETVVLCTSEYHVKRFFMSAEKLYKKMLKKLNKNIKMELALSK